MIRNQARRAMLSMTLVAVALTACQRQIDVTPAALKMASASSPSSSRTPSAVAHLSITAVELGTVQRHDRRVADPRGDFARSDTIVVAVATRASGGAVPGRLTVRCRDAHGRTIKEESRPALFSGAGISDFRIAKPKGWALGRYAVEISLDGHPPRKHEFVVR